MLLRLLQLADSAIPVGGLAHSFGLETLVEQAHVTAGNLEQFLGGWIEETGVLEAYYCAEAARRPGEFAALNQSLAARKPAREAREGSAAMGRRLMDLAARAWGITRPETSVLQYACCFGYVAGALGIEAGQATAAFLHQAVTGQISAAQRLLPLGHTDAQAIRFRLTSFIDTATAQALSVEQPPPSFAPLTEIAQMNHPAQVTRLFVS